MLRIYLKQAWELMKQNRLFSTLYIVGTALAIAMTMMMAIIYYVRLAPVYPEERRATTIYMGQVRVEEKSENSFSSITGSLSYNFVDEKLRTLEGVDLVAAYYRSQPGYNYIQLSDGRGELPVIVTYADPLYFRLYTFRFKEGAAFTQDDFDGGMYRVVITDHLARQVFHTDKDVVGRTFLVNYKPYTVCGVVEAASRLMDHSYAEVYCPYSVDPAYRDVDTWNGNDQFGRYRATLVAKTPDDVPVVLQGLNELVRQYNTAHQSENKVMSFVDGPFTHWEQVLQGTAGADGNMQKAVRHFLLIVLVLLLVPSLNLSGLIASRMESRLAEMGIRKTFGAWRSTLLNMVLWENLLLTFMGGVLGLLLAWGCIFLGRGWVFTILDSYALDLADEATFVSGEMLFAPLVFVAALALCLVLNILSALVPAWWSLRHPIVQSLYQKR